VLAGLGVLGALAIVAAAAPWIAPFGPNEIAGRPFAPPGGPYLLGTDDVGHDVLSQLIYGARVSLGVAAAVAAASTLLSWTAGIGAALWTRVEGPVLALADLLLALPNLPLAMLVVLLLGASVQSIVLTLTILSWPAFARIIRAQALAVRRAPYVDAARALGARERHVALRHVLPATMALLPAKLVLTVRSVLFAEATLAFLGLGDPAAASWGTMLGWAFNDPLLFSRAAWTWWVVPPAIAIAVAVLAVSLAAGAAGDTAPRASRG
jgi:ABC-type dipeptide/oligopeptide/nickel transport system permease subunit